MSSFGSGRGNVLYIVACAAPPTRDTPALVDDLQRVGWETCVILTPAATRWVDVKLVTEASGRPVRSEFRGPDDPEFQPKGDAVVVAPASFNTINQCAAGINDNLALGLINEALGGAIPLAVVPCVNDALAAHPAYKNSLRTLESAGVRVAAPELGQDHVQLAVQAVGAPPTRPAVMP